MALRSADRRLLAWGVLAALVLTIAMTAPIARADPKVLCRLDGDRLVELSGLAADADSLYAVNDGGTQVEVVVLDRDCREQRTITADIDPYDVEDLAIDGSGTLWLADTGDNRKARDTVAIIKVDRNGRASLHRLTYPDGQHDAEAILLSADGVPHVVTKNLLGNSEVYRPTGELASPGPTPMEKVADVGFSATDTPGGPPRADPVASMLVTGGAVSHDGTVVALRTYTDVYLWHAPDGDIVRALRGDPVAVPLPREPQGEAIAFAPDGTLLSGSEGSGQPIRAVADATGMVAPAGSNGSGSEGGSGAAEPDSTGAAENERSPLPALAVAVLAAVVLWFGLSRVRRRR